MIRWLLKNLGIVSVSKLKMGLIARIFFAQGPKARLGRLILLVVYNLCDTNFERFFIEDYHNYAIRR